MADRLHKFTCSVEYEYDSFSNNAVNSLGNKEARNAEAE